MGHSDDERWMREALRLARLAGRRGEVPVGAVAVAGGRRLASASNRMESALDATSHAEMSCLRGASRALQSWRLTGVTLYVTLEPCPMCAGAAILARVPLVVFAAPDPKAGAVVSIAQLFEERQLNHHPKWRTGVLRAESEALLRDFFATHRDVPSA
jgi:tRNA(adenine34) deaminase